MPALLAPGTPGQIPINVPAPQPVVPRQQQPEAPQASAVDESVFQPIQSPAVTLLPHHVAPRTQRQAAEQAEQMSKRSLRIRFQQAATEQREKAADSGQQLIPIPDERQPNSFSCILPGQELQGKVIGGSKARYAGEAVEILTGSGKTLRVTANHPVMTMMGFVPASQLKKGHSLLNYVGENKPFASSDDVQNAPAVVEEVFRSLCRISDPVFLDETSGIAFEFHGDAKFFKGQIEVVGSYRQLWSDSKAKTDQVSGENVFTSSDFGKVPLASSSLFNANLDWDGDALGGLVGGGSLSQSGLSIHAGPDYSSGFFPASNRDACAFQNSLDGALGNRHFLGESLDSISGLISSDDLVGIGDSGFGAECLNARFPESCRERLVTHPEFGGKIPDSLPLGVPNANFRNVGDDLLVGGLDLVGGDLIAQDDSTEGENVTEFLGAHANACGKTFEPLPTDVPFCDLIDASDIGIFSSGCISDSLVFGSTVSASRCNATSFGPASLLDTPLRKYGANAVNADMVLASELVLSESGSIVLDEIVDIVKFHYDGPVYDFESPLGWIVINNLLVGNCGAASAMAVGRFFGVGPQNIQEWEKALDTTKEKSTNPFKIVEYLQSLGLSAIPKYKMTIADLKTACGEGSPVIVCVKDYDSGSSKIKAQKGYGHFLTVIGTIDDQYVVCQDSSEDNIIKEGSNSIQAPGKVIIDNDTFLKNWWDETTDGQKLERFGIIVSKPKSADAQKMARFRSRLRERMQRMRGPVRMARGSEDEAGLRRSIAADPDSATPKLVFADWLEEHGDPQSVAEAARLRVQARDAELVNQIHHVLATGGNPSDLYEQLHSHFESTGSPAMAAHVRRTVDAAASPRNQWPRNQIDPSVLALPVNHSQEMEHLTPFGWSTSVFGGHGRWQETLTHRSRSHDKLLHFTAPSQSNYDQGTGREAWNRPGTEMYHEPERMRRGQPTRFDRPIRPPLLPSERASNDRLMQSLKEDAKILEADERRDQKLRAEFEKLRQKAQEYVDKGRPIPMDLQTRIQELRQEVGKLERLRRQGVPVRMEDYNEDFGKAYGQLIQQQAEKHFGVDHPLTQSFKRTNHWGIALNAARKNHDLAHEILNRWIERIPKMSKDLKPEGIPGYANKVMRILAIPARKGLTPGEYNQQYQQRKVQRPAASFHDQISGYLRQAGSAGMGHGELLKRLNIHSHQLRSAIGEMVGAGKVRRQIIPGKGRPQMRYFHQEI